MERPCLPQDVRCESLLPETEMWRGPPLSTCPTVPAILESEYVYLFFYHFTFSDPNRSFEAPIWVIGTGISHIVVKSLSPFHEIEA